MMMKKTFIFILTCVSLLFAACDKQDDTYREFVVPGGYNYPAKPVELKTQAGYLRIALSWAIPKDPAVKSVKVFWDNYAKSSDVDYSSAVDGFVTTVISDLEDRSYTFDIVNFDEDGNRSLASEITVAPYGEGWLSTHAERKILTARVKDNTATIEMGNPMDEMVGTKFRYRNLSGEWVESEQILKAGESSVEIPGVLKGKYFEYKSSYCPANGLDTVWNSYWTRSPEILEYKLDPTLWEGSITKNQLYTGSGDYGWAQLFDGITDVQNNGYRANTAAAYRAIFPKIIAVDTHAPEGKEPVISHIEMYQHPTTQSYRYVKSLSLFQGNAPYDADTDDYTSFGTPVLDATFTQAEVVQGRDASDPVPGRYFAIVFTKSFATQGYIWVQEFEPWGYVPSETE